MFVRQIFYEVWNKRRLKGKNYPNEVIDRSRENCWIKKRLGPRISKGQLWRDEIQVSVLWFAEWPWLLECGLFEKLCLCELVTGGRPSHWGVRFTFTCLSTSLSGKRGGGTTLEMQRGTQSEKDPKNTNGLAMHAQAFLWHVASNQTCNRQWWRQLSCKIVWLPDL